MPEDDQYTLSLSRGLQMGGIYTCRKYEQGRGRWT